MVPTHSQSEPELPFPVPFDRFDQKNEMFKRVRWDPELQPLAQRLFGEVKYKQKAGYQKVDYALRNASWNLEWGAAFGNSRGNSGLYAWEGLPEKIKHFAEADGPVTKSPAEMSLRIKKAAGLFGADLVGICKLHPNWVYSREYNLFNDEHTPIDIPKGCDNAIVMAVAMDYEAMRSAPNGIGSAATGMGYSQMASTANLLAGFIRGMGYRAIPCGNDTALSIPLAMAAGLGESSRMGLLVTRKFGPRVRLCKVFTDLPIEVDHYRPFGVTAFCRTCKKCAQKCPSQAISSGEMTSAGSSLSNQSGVKKWYINPENCFSFWASNRTDCSVCIRVCPYNKPSGILHDIVPAISRKTTRFNPFFVWLDDLCGYGKYVAAGRYWKV